MARISERERRVVRRSLGPGWVRIAEREVRNEATALSDTDVLIWEEHIDQIREENGKWKAALTKQASSGDQEGEGR